MARPIENLAGRKFDRLVVVELYESQPGKARWLCRCECGTEVVALAKSLKSQNTKSCGCLQRERTATVSLKHGKAGTRTHRIWSGMRERCREGGDYYDAGIRVHPFWEDFIVFLKDMGECPTSRHILDRRDGTKGYEPGNCRWVTPQQSAANTSRHRDSKHRFKGIGFVAGRKKPWKAEICFRGKRISLGYWATDLEAARAYDTGAIKYFGEYAKTNFDPTLYDVKEYQ